MLGRHFFQKWDQGTWGISPAMGFLWATIYNLCPESGQFGLDTLLAMVIIAQK